MKVEPMREWPSRSKRHTEAVRKWLADGAGFVVVTHLGIVSVSYGHEAGEAHVEELGRNGLRCGADVE
jgi:hypothetical protein